MDIVILGDGPMRDDVQRAAERPGSRLIYKGFMPHDQILDFMRSARVLIMPSIWYEGGLPLVVIEAFSLGLPVIGADLGNVAAIIKPGETGLLYPPADHHALAAALVWFTDNPAAVLQMRKNARAHYLATHTPEKNYQRLVEIYQMTVDGAVGRQTSTP
jgi:glycosyltransferase involved in cell wall biosynthesis